MGERILEHRPAVTRVLDEMRTLIDIAAAPTLATVTRWAELLSAAEEDDPIVISARARARRDA